MKFDYEKNKAIKNLKNEIFGLEQMASVLEKFIKLDFSKFDEKVINIKLLKFLKEQLPDCNWWQDYNYITFIVPERYNRETQSYIQGHDRGRISISSSTTINASGKESKPRLNASATVAGAKKDIEKYLVELAKYKEELQNIGAIVEQYKQLHQAMSDFKSQRTYIFRDAFSSLNKFY